MQNRFLVLDCWISRTNMATAIDSVLQRSAAGDGGYICFSNVHSIVTSCHDACLREITNASFMAMPDGKPVALLGRWLNIEGISQVPGPDFMVEFMTRTPTSRHYLYGATETTLSLLSRALRTRIPGLNIVGSYAPPFRDLTVLEETEIISEINKIGPDYIWIGIGAPRQEYWMARNWKSLTPAVLFGVGAAFDFHAGVKARAPRWMRSAGLEWLHRLLTEPRRLWRRYLTTNSVFLFRAARILVRHRFSVWAGRS